MSKEESQHLANLAKDSASLIEVTISGRDKDITVSNLLLLNALKINCLRIKDCPVSFGDQTPSEAVSTLRELHMEGIRESIPFSELLEVSGILYKSLDKLHIIGSGIIVLQC